MNKLVNKTAQWLVSSVLCVSATSHAAVTFSNQPLAAVGSQFGPNLMLGLSVEFPTAGPAYSTEGTFNNNSMATVHHGYFDPYRCYQYVSSDSDGQKAYANLNPSYKTYTGAGKPILNTKDTNSTAYANFQTMPGIPFWNIYYGSNFHQPFPWTPFLGANQTGGVNKESFKAVAWAKMVTPPTADSVTPNANGVTPNYITCNNNGATNQFSGNFLNWASMSAVDILRKTLTGGNRALGPGQIKDFAANTDTSNIIYADPATDYSDGDTASASYLRRANIFLNNGANYTGRQVSLKNFANYGYILPPVYSPDTANYSNWFAMNFDGTVPNSTNATYANKDRTDNTGGLNIVVSGFQFDIRSRFRSQWMQANKIFNDNAASASASTVYRYFAPNKFHVFPYSAVVKACDDAAFITGKADSFGQLPPTSEAGYTPNYEQCQLYPNGSYKPAGQIQKNSNTARFGVMGYLNENDNSINGGVLRARMKYVANPTPATAQTVTTSDNQSVQLGDEIVANTGQFNINPDSADATATATTYSTPIPNSGVINYLNKFGDGAGYKTYDPVGELFYNGIRYFEHQGSIYKPGTMTAAYLDSFPAIYNWEDPLVSANTAAKPKEAICRPNTMMIIGDTNTHFDNALPNYMTGGEPNSGFTASQWKDGNPTDPVIQTKTSLVNLLTNEGVANASNNGVWNQSIGDNTTRGMAGVAYSAHVSDIRPDLKNKVKPVTVSSFLIDVVEAASFKTNLTNQFWLAAKYGGFDTTAASNTTVNGLPMPAKASDSSWAGKAPTDPAALTSYNAALAAFPSGVPKNYAPANNPAAMISAINGMFNSIAVTGTPTQAGIGAAAQVLPATIAANVPRFLKGTYQSSGWSGDLLAQSNLGTTGATVWSANTIMTGAFHNPASASSNYTQRNVFTRAGSSTDVLSFADTNSSALMATMGQADDASTKNLINYTLGDPSNESTGLYRTRTALMGTVVNSTPAAIYKSTTAPIGCTFAAGAQSTSTYFTVAANDGMLHLFNSAGTEKAAYMPSTSLPYLYRYAQPGYQHAYINDGSPLVQAACFGATAKNLLITSTGYGASGLNTTGTQQNLGGVYAIDATNLDSIDASKFLWEFTSKDDQDLGVGLSQPILTTDASGHPIVLINSGYNPPSNVDKGYLFVLYADKAANTAWQLGTNYFKIELGKSGVGGLTGFSKANNGIYDRVYVGDNAGALWRVNIGSTNQWKDGAVAFSGQPLIQTNPAYPITGAPAVTYKGGVSYVTFGTGRRFDVTDLPTVASPLQNYAYGIFDDKGGNSITDDATHITTETVTGTVASKLGTAYGFYTTSSNVIPSTAYGWKVKLPVNAMITSYPVVDGSGVVMFPVIQPLASDDPSNAANCDPNQSGNSIILPIKLATGSQPVKSWYAGMKSDLAQAIPTVDLNAVGMPSTGLIPRIGVAVVATGGGGGGGGGGGSSSTDDGTCNSGLTLTYAGTTVSGGPCTLGGQSFSRLSWRELFN